MGIYTAWTGWVVVAYVLAFGGGQLPRMLESSAASIWVYSELPYDHFHDVAERGLILLNRQVLEGNERIPWGRQKIVESSVLRSWWDVEAVDLHLETR